MQDVDIGMKQISVRHGKGNKDRVTTFPVSIVPALVDRFKGVKHQHEKDLTDGLGEVYLPHALDRKYRGAAKAWGWQYVFPARDISLDPRRGLMRRHHIDPSVINKAINVAVRNAGCATRVSAHTFRQYTELDICATVLRRIYCNVEPIFGPSRLCWVIGI